MPNRLTACLVLLLASLVARTTAAAGTITDWQVPITITTQDPNAVRPVATIYVATAASASDAYVAQEDLLYPPTPPSSGGVAALRIRNTDPTTGSTSYYYKDVRAPLAPNASESWSLLLSASSLSPAATAVTISWAVDDVPSSIALVLEEVGGDANQDGQTSYDMRAVSEYTIATVPASGVRFSITATRKSSPSDITLAVSPTHADVALGGVQRFTAQITGQATGVVWSVSGPPGVPAGSIDQNGVYTAPDEATTPASGITVTAAVEGRPDVNASVTVSLLPLSVAIVPSSAVLRAGESKAFVANLRNSPAGAIKWELESGPGELAVDPQDVTKVTYKAPDTLSRVNTAVVRLSSLADPTKTAEAWLTLTPAIVLHVDPADVAMFTGQSQVFTATASSGMPPNVAWRLEGTEPMGTLVPMDPDPTGAPRVQYVAPSSVPDPPSVRVVAVSTSDANMSAYSTVHLQAVVRGDLTGDGRVSVADVTVALRISVGLAAPSAAQLAAGDLDGSGQISIAEVQRILRAALGLGTL